MDQRITAITLGVADTGRARALYERLGWSGRSPDGDVVFFQAGGMVLALWGRDRLAEDSAVDDAAGWGGVTLAYNVASPAAVDAVLEAARAAGARIGRPGATTFWGGYTASSSTPTATPGRWPTTRGGPWATTGRSNCPDRGPAVRPAHRHP